MQKDERSMADKIFADLEAVIMKDEYLEDFMVVPVALSQNKSPVIHISHNICLESWCIKHIYNYAHQKLLEYRKSVSRMKLLAEECKIIKRLLLGALFINPEVLTFWNMRRELLIEHFLNINTELRISRLILTYKSKSVETFSYRKWLLLRIINKEIHDKNFIDNILNDELSVCDMTAQKNQNNYHSWCHRIWCLENIATFGSNLSLVLKRELNFSENWISLHVSEHTGFHFRQFVINKISNIELVLDNKYYDCTNKLFDNVAKISTRDKLISIFGTTDQMWNEINISLMFNSVSLLLYELMLNEELNYLYVDHEAIWYHRRFILYNLLLLICAYFGVHSTNLKTFAPYYDNDSNIVSSNNISSYVPNKKLDPRGEKCPKINCDFNVIQSSNLYKFMVQREAAMVNKYAKKSFNDRNFDLAKRHEKWLRYILGVSEI